VGGGDSDLDDEDDDDGNRSKSAMRSARSERDEMAAELAWVQRQAAAAAVESEETILELMDQLEEDDERGEEEQEDEGGGYSEGKNRWTGNRGLQVEEEDEEEEEDRDEGAEEERRRAHEETAEVERRQEIEAGVQLLLEQQQRKQKEQLEQTMYALADEHAKAFGDAKGKWKKRLDEATAGQRGAQAALLKVTQELAEARAAARAKANAEAAIEEQRARAEADAAEARVREAEAVEARRGAEASSRILQQEVVGHTATMRQQLVEAETRIARLQGQMEAKAGIAERKDDEIKRMAQSLRSADDETQRAEARVLEADRWRQRATLQAEEAVANKLEQGLREMQAELEAQLAKAAGQLKAANDRAERAEHERGEMKELLVAAVRREGEAKAWGTHLSQLCAEQKAQLQTQLQQLPAISQRVEQAEEEASASRRREEARATEAEVLRARLQVAEQAVDVERARAAEAEQALSAEVKKGEEVRAGERRRAEEAEAGMASATEEATRWEQGCKVKEAMVDDQLQVAQRLKDTLAQQEEQHRRRHERDEDVLAGLKEEVEALSGDREGLEDRTNEAERAATRAEQELQQLRDEWEERQDKGRTQWEAEAAEEREELEGQLARKEEAIGYVQAEVDAMRSTLQQKQQKQEQEYAETKAAFEKDVAQLRKNLEESEAARDEIVVQLQARTAEHSSNLVALTEAHAKQQAAEMKVASTEAEMKVLLMQVDREKSAAAANLRQLSEAMLGGIGTPQSSLGVPASPPAPRST
jgi:hypothetical protein